ncbi:hypothetical protein AO391_26410 [Pseudomonas marginalis ICMP 9505]|nr:hypothetical protein AO391_26410 [Pseudomonas marginalis ICMP 9505]
MSLLLIELIERSHCWVEFTEQLLQAFGLGAGRCTIVGLSLPSSSCKPSAWAPVAAAAFLVASAWRSVEPIRASDSACRRRWSAAKLLADEPDDSIAEALVFTLVVRRW